jgi:hypothetical protein
MQTEPNSPSWLSFVDRAADESSLLRLMVLNPFNGAMSTFVNELIDVDPPGYEPRADDLHTDAHSLHE